MASIKIYKRNQKMLNNSELIKQLSFYLSDENLQNDQFFYKEVAADNGHYVAISSFLKCNKLKKMGVTKANQIVEAVGEADDLELNKASTKLRRKSLQDLPEFKAKKKVKSEQKPQDQEPNPFDHFQSVIFSMNIDKEEKVSFKFIKEGLLKNHGVFSPYVRFNKNEGNFAVEKKLCTQEIIAKLQKYGLKIGETKITIKKTEGTKLDEFGQNHGHHYNGIIDNLRKDQQKRSKEQKRNASKNKKVKEFKFAGEKYDDLNKLKSLFKNIVCRNPNNVPLKETETKYVKELLSYHDSAAEKMRDFDHFIVDANPQYSDTRCLYVVRKDRSREDFSVLKCVNNILVRFADS